MLIAILVMFGLALTLGVILGVASLKLRVEGNPLAGKVEAMLPQTQCGQCGYPGCAPYAQAVVAGEAKPNLCVPGGDAVAKNLANLLGVEFEPVGGDGGEAQHAVRVAFIDENTCIGCTACLKACPVDAIVGSNKLMHTILPSHCTGCELCVAACPVECIGMVPVTENISTWKWKYPIHELKKAA